MKSAASPTRVRLIEAAMSEFIDHGFAGTDTNRIARRAGFAPQTFYRWFADKTAVFAEVLHVWEEAEFAALSSLLADPGGLSEVQWAEACVENTRPFLTFKQHLRSVMLQNAELRELRAGGRCRLIDRLSPMCPHLPREDLASTVLQIESFSEMLARGDAIDMGVLGGSLLQALAEQIRCLQAR